ncbi:DEAD/DEAH box helicase family protein [Leptospira sp. 201903075]|uniref:helicase-related protein n=1 Tax=Leptospira chreensis TaxID=2810035 RepID=UPI00196664F0|nr:helicase-related protein [Leptospira chreensis]MBM9592367.1 DEAD/DEAH box helicase family protein [Leptospira chreensis]
MVQKKSKKINPILAAPQRIRCRDSEWIVKRAEIYDPIHQFQKVQCIGIDALVKNQERIFIEPIDEFEVVDPKSITVALDESAGFQRSLFYLEARLRSLPVTGETSNWSQLGVYRPYEFQKYSAKLAVSKSRARLLIADGVGLGKTIQVGMILTDLARRGLAERILVLTKKSMLTQFQAELWNKFNLPLVRMDSEAISKVRIKIPANKNPFDVYHRVIMSLDTLKQQGKYEKFLLDTKWDVVVIDEAHNVAGASKVASNLSYRLARNLASRTTHLLLTTATPHNGKRETFARLLSLVDPASISDPEMKDYTAEEISDHFLMRFKEDVRSQIGDQMKDRVVIPLSESSLNANPNEIEILDIISNLRTSTKIKKEKRESLRLLQYGYYKLFLSSPEAVLSTVKKRKNRIELGKEIAEISNEMESLQLLEGKLSDLSLASSTRYSILKKHLTNLAWDGKEKSPKVLIFTEYLETQKALVAALAKDFQLEVASKPEEYHQSQILTIDGSHSDTSLSLAIEAFATTNNQVRLLVATDVASEGINLHHACHLIIHYDLPWSVITLIQRNGRIDRIGQTKTPEIRYLQVTSGNSSFANDEAVFQRLVTKVEEINHLRKEGESILNLFDSKKEEEYIADKILEGVSPDEILATPVKAEDSLDDEMQRILDEAIALQQNKLDSESSNEKQTPTALSQVGEVSNFLYNDRDFFIKGYEFLSKKASVSYPSLEIQNNYIGFTPPKEVKERLGAPDSGSSMIYGATSLPKEVWQTVGHQFRLTDDATFMENAILAAQNESGHWTRASFLNKTHPILKWLVDRLLLEFPKGQVPMIVSPDIPKDVLLYFFIGHVSSRAGNPIVAEPHVVMAKPGQKQLEVLSFQDAIAMTNLRNIANTKVPPNQKPAEIFLAKAVDTSLEYLQKLASKRKEHLLSQYRKEVRRLDAWRVKREAYIEKMSKNILSGQAAFEKWQNKKKWAIELCEAAKLSAEERLQQTADPITEPILIMEGSK